MIKFLFGFLLAIIIVITGVAAFFGLVPGLSPLIGAGPKDLLVRFTPEDSKAARDKMGTQIITLPANTPISDDFKLEGKRNAEIDMDSKELTAHSNNRPWKNYPDKNVQIRIHQDGTVEGSGTLIISKAMPYAMALGYSQSQIEDAMKKYRIPPFEVPVYLIGKGSVTNNKVTITTNQLKIGAVNVPKEIVNQASSEAESVVEDLIQKHNQSFNCESLTFSDGKMHFKGQLPEKEYVIGN